MAGGGEWGRERERERRGEREKSDDLIWLPGVRAHHVLRETQYTTATRVNCNMEYSSVMALQDLHTKLKIMSSLHHNNYHQLTAMGLPGTYGFQYRSTLSRPPVAEKVKVHVY